MKGKIGILIIAVGMMSIGSMTTDAGAFEVLFADDTVFTPSEEVDLVRTADSFIVLFDSSSSMGDRYRKTKMRKIDMAMDILEKKNKEIPDLTYNAGLYAFPAKSKFGGKKMLEPYYEVRAYNKTEFTRAIGQLPKKGGGATPLQPALRELEPILKGLPGRTVVYVYNDGQYSRFFGPKPDEMAKELADKYDVCFYMIHNARGKTEEKTLKATASINECSRKVSFDEVQREPDILTAALYGFGKKAVMRPESRMKVVGARAENIMFDFDKSDIKPEFHEELDALGKFMQEHPRAHVTLSGFTDSIGHEGYNMGLSRKRVESVSHYLAKNFNIGEERVVLNWYGEAGPAANNDTMEGRRENRRVTSFVAGLN